MHLSSRQWLGIVAASAAVVLLALVLLLPGGGNSQVALDPVRIPDLGNGSDPATYVPSHEHAFEQRAATGVSHVVFALSPGGVVETAKRVAAFRPQIEAAARVTGTDPDTIEAIVFLESAGRSTVVAGKDPASAAGLSQILAQTGQSLLKMHVDLPASRKLTAAIIKADHAGMRAKVRTLQHQRAKIDDRFNPAKALLATGRYLDIARSHFGRDDLAVVSYHMGIGNLDDVIRNYVQPAAVNGSIADEVSSNGLSYAQLYFGSTPLAHAPAWSLLSRFGDDSSNYYWKVLASEAIMRLYRQHPAQLEELARLEAGNTTQADAFHPPSNGTSPAASASPEAHATLAYIQRLVRQVSGATTPLTVTAMPAGGSAYSFEVRRKYASKGQAEAFQFALDRLRALAVLDYLVEPKVVHIVVSNGARSLLPLLDNQP